MKALLLLALLLAGVVEAKAELAPVVEIAIPDGGGLIRLALPPRLCGYPGEVRDRLARFLSDGGVRLLGLAGDCDGIARLLREGTAMVSPSLQLAILESEVAPATRSKPVAYRRHCFEQFPEKQTASMPDTLRQSLKDVDGKLTVGEAVSLGLLAATRDAVFGGLLTELSRDPHRVLQIQVVVCFSPSDVPLMWAFQETVDRGTDLNIVAGRLRAVLALAQSQVKATMDLGRVGTPPR